MLLFTVDNKKDLNRLYWAIEPYYIGNTAVVFGCRIWQCDVAFTPGQTFELRFIQTILSCKLVIAASRVRFNPPPPLPYLALQSGGGRDAKKHETAPRGSKLHPYLRGNRPFIRPRVAIDLRMRKWKDYSVMERAITGLRGSKRVQPVSEYLSVHWHWSGYLFIRGALADRVAWPLEQPLSAPVAEPPCRFEGWEPHSANTSWIQMAGV